MENFNTLGFAIVRNVLTPETLQEALLSQLQTLTLAPLSGGIRRIDQHSASCAALSVDAGLLNLIAPFLNGQPQLVRAIYFDKTPSNNWLVTWHQDKTVCVSQRFEADGWQPWSLKAGVWHVQPPLKVLQNMITVRIHLDAAHRGNGCLKIIPRSHTLGILDNATLQNTVHQHDAYYCEVQAGDAVIMRPHLLHASEKSTLPLSRRVLHFEYASYTLPDGITWSP